MLKGGLRGILSLSVVGFSFLGLSFLVSALFNPVGQSSAAPQTAEQTASSYTTSMSNDSNVNISVSPTSEQTIYSASNNITVLNDCPAGVTITLSSSDNSNSLISGNSDTIQATVSNGLSSNSWGVSLDNGNTWNAVPVYGDSSIEVYNKNSSENTAFTIPILFGIRMDNNIPSGKYEGNIIYTMTPNAGCLTYSVSWNFDGATDPGSYPNVINQDGTVNLSLLVKPTRSYYRFAGFSNGAQTFTGNETAADINPEHLSSVEMVALWTPEVYTITYSLGGGSASNPTSYTIETNTFTLTNPTKSGVTFSGWSGTGLSGKNNKTVTIPKGSTGNRGYTANWAPTTTTWNFGYTGGTQSFSVPATGTYKLEVWGAQGGGGYKGSGGAGGYSYGNASLTAGQVIYIVVGGQGTKPSCSSDTSDGPKSVVSGYNGGGTGGCYFGAAGTGGGATHIGKTNALLKDTAVANLFIVAGGGGGGGGVGNYGNGNGGSGGGTNGGSGDKGGCDYAQYGTGGTQSGGGVSAGTNTAGNGSYGQGGNAVMFPGGGGGYYGGGASSEYGGTGGAGGGSGYIGGVTGGSMSNGQRTGSGYARITWVN